MTPDYIAADLFCGADGTSTGLVEAAQDLGLQVKVIAVNHWDVAIATHKENHPFADHYCEAVENLDPRKVVPGGHLRLLVASPECRYHSNARGGRAINDQLRTSPWDILRWMEALYIEDVLIENVPEFTDWGPLDEAGKKIKAQKGKIFLQYIHTIRSLGYRIDYRVLNAADYGDPTTRERLFIICRRKRRIAWPEPTHTRNPEQARLDGRQLEPWRTAREIIDWAIPGESIYTRKRPLVDNTLRRIAAGLRKFSGLPFILPAEGFYRGNSPRSLDEPLQTIVASRGNGHIVQPFLIQMNGTREGQIQATALSADSPLPTVTGSNHFGLVQPFVLSIRGGNDGYTRGASIDDPLPAVTTVNPMALIQPFLIGQQSCAAPRSVDEPVPTVATKGAISLVQPFIINMEHTRRNGSAPAGDPFVMATNHGGDTGRVYPLDEPMRTVTTVDAWGIVQPFLVEYHGETSPNGQRVRSVDEPLPAVATANQHGLVQPYLIKYYGSGDGAISVDAPLPTITTKDRFGLIEPLYFLITDQLYMLDILFRMLLPHELAAAQGFRAGYRFTGKREDVVKQIGNAVPCNLARALCRSLLAEPARRQRKEQSQ